MTRLRRALILLGALVIAALLAFPLRETIHDSVVVPAAFIGWNLNLIYLSFSQGIWWWVIVFVVFLMVFASLLPRSSFPHRVETAAKSHQGQVQGLAVWLQKAEGGVYFKWLIANKLGKLAHQILLYRESGKERSVFAPLMGEDWQPTPELQEYLEKGLHGSFAEFPNTKLPFGARPSHTIGL